MTNVKSVYMSAPCRENQLQTVLTVHRVDDQDVEIPEPENRLRRGEINRSPERCSKQRPKCSLLIMLAPPLHIASLLSLLLCAASQKSWAIGLRHGCHQEKRDTSQDEREPMDPPPAQVVEHKAADQGSYDGPIHESNAPDTEGEGPMLVCRDIVDCTGRVRHNRASNHGSEEATYEDRPYILCKGARQDEKHKGEKRCDVDRSTSEHFLTRVSDNR